MCKGPGVRKEPYQTFIRSSVDIGACAMKLGRRARQGPDSDHFIFVACGIWAIC
jgi:hypothetical protein